MPDRVICRKKTKCLLYANGKEEWIAADHIWTTLILTSDTQDPEWVKDGLHLPKSD